MAMENATRPVSQPNQSVRPYSCPIRGITLAIKANRNPNATSAMARGDRIQPPTGNSKEAVRWISTVADMGRPLFDGFLAPVQPVQSLRRSAGATQLIA